MKILRSADIEQMFGVRSKKALSIMESVGRINIGTEHKPLWVVKDTDVERWLNSKREGCIKKTNVVGMIPTKRKGA